MKIKFEDFEAFLEYYYKQQSQGVLPSDEVSILFEEKGLMSSLILSFIDSDSNICKIHLYDSSVKSKPKLIKEMLLNTRISKEEN